MTDPHAPDCGIRTRGICDCGEWPAIVPPTSAEVRKALIAEILNVPQDEHFDRVARINAPMVLASGKPLYGDDGYRNPELLYGCNVVRKYLMMLALDHGVDITKGPDA